MTYNRLNLPSIDDDKRQIDGFFTVKENSSRIIDIPINQDVKSFNFHEEIDGINADMDKGKIGMFKAVKAVLRLHKIQARDNINKAIKSLYSKAWGCSYAQWVEVD